MGNKYVMLITVQVQKVIEKGILSKKKNIPKIIAKNIIKEISSNPTSKLTSFHPLDPPISSSILSSPELTQNELN